MNRMHHSGAAAPTTIDKTFDALLLADDLEEVCRLYADFFGGVDAAAWGRPVKGRSNEWTLRETVAHLCALNGAGLECVANTLNGEPYVFRGLRTRYELDAYNRSGIEDLRGLSTGELCDEFLRVHGGAARIARSLTPEQAALTAPMPIYNRDIEVIEALSIIVMHAGLVHTAQVAEPAGQTPLWTQLSPAMRHRQIGRAMRAFSLLYRRDIGGDLRATFAFQVDGPGGGHWYVDVAPGGTTAGERDVAAPTLRLRFRRTDDFCRMLTVRLNPPIALLTRRLRLRGDLRLFRRMSQLFSVDARP